MTTAATHNSTDVISDRAQPDLAAAFEACRQITRKRARNFYYGLRLTPGPKRDAIYSVYAWMRQADDATDAHTTAQRRREALARITHTTERLITGESLGDREHDPVWIAFRATLDSYRLDPADLRGMLSALELDIEHDERFAALARDGHLRCAFETRRDLESYCFGVASTVGLICITIWGLCPDVRLQTARELAIRRGLAFQLTNILRDFVEDAREARVYLPAEDFRAAGINPDALREWSNDDACTRIVRGMASWARKAYDESAPLDQMILPECRPALLTMTRIYSGILSIIERHPRRIAAGRRIRLPSVQKIAIALRAAAEARTASRPAEAVATAVQ